MSTNQAGRNRILLFLLSQSVTLFGSTLVQMAIVWYVTLRTLSGAWVAAFTAASYLPQFLVSFVGGVWADRHSRKALIIGADALIAAVTLAMIFLMPSIGTEPLLLAALLALSVLRSFGDTYWYLTAVELVGFFGMMGGGVLMSTWGGFKSRMKTLTLGLAAFGALAIGMGLSQNFVLYLALMLFYGIALTMVQTATTTLVQENAAPAMQGRVFGLLSSMYAGFLPIGMAIFGPMADVVPLGGIMIGSGAALLLVSAFAKACETNEPKAE